MQLGVRVDWVDRCYGVCVCH